MDEVRRRAVGIHVFAGGFTAGVADVFDVGVQLEVHGLGVKTTELVWGVPVHLSRAEDWPQDLRAPFAFGNPRCTGFSCVTAGYGDDAHGPRAKQCQDILDLMAYSLGRFDVFVWESVQQAYGVGKPLLDELRDRALAAGYRVAYVFVNAATFGNPQDRKRFFAVYYPRERQFNVSVPSVDDYYATVYDAIWDKRHRPYVEWHPRSADYGEDSVLELQQVEKDILPYLYSGWSLNQVAQYETMHCCEKFQRMWRLRSSGMPFSMHTVYRTSWLRPCPTLKNSAGRLVHPWHHRQFTIGELAACMGWRGRIPVGKDPVSQIAKGVVPDVGTWIAEQALACLDDRWGGEDYECTYDPYQGRFVGRDTHGADEKVIDVTKYRGHKFDLSRYPDEAFRQCHRYNIDPMTGKLLRDWKEVPHRRPQYSGPNVGPHPATDPGEL